MAANPALGEKDCLRLGVRKRRRVAAWFAAGCQVELGLCVGVVDPRAKRRFWE
jgi:hypothetical protein